MKTAKSEKTKHWTSTSACFGEPGWTGSILYWNCTSVSSTGEVQLEIDTNVEIGRALISSGHEEATWMGRIETSSVWIGLEMARLMIAYLELRHNTCKVRTRALTLDIWEPLAEKFFMNGFTWASVVVKEESLFLSVCPEMNGGDQFIGSSENFKIEAGYPSDLKLGVLN
ncbi:unnamed protein product [Prunus armeniaca]